MYHEPVLLLEVVEQLVTSPGGLYLDCTLGGGGHSRAMLALLDSKGQLHSLDRDEDAIAHVKAADWSRDSRFIIHHTPFSELQHVLDKELSFNGILMDLGVSSHQIDEAERGFSFMRKGPLDMRMDRSKTEDASSLVARSTVAELGRILRDYGEVRNWKAMATEIARMREREALVTCQQLKDGLEARFGCDKSYKWLSQVFQALRIAVNEEMEELEQGLDQAFGRLAPGGRLAVMSYHSLEDRITKRRFRNWSASNADYASRHLPAANRQALGRELNRKAIQAAKDEQKSNPRSRSVRLRVIEKLSVESN